MKIILNRLAKLAPADWYDRVLVLWTEDECLRNDPTAEHLPDAWKRYTQQSWVKREPEIANHNGGDCLYTLFPRGWVVLSSFDGDSIGRLVDVDMRKKAPGVEAAEIIKIIRASVIEEVAQMFDAAAVLYDSATPGLVPALGDEEREAARRVRTMADAPSDMSVLLPGALGDAAIEHDATREALDAAACRIRALKGNPAVWTGDFGKHDNRVRG